MINNATCDNSLAPSRCAWRGLLACGCGLAMLAATAPPASAQVVCLAAPRLLTTTPMGGQAGTRFDLTITGDNLEQAGPLSFSHAGITATQKLGEDGKPLANQYVVSIADDCPSGVHEARVMTRLGVSSSRAFSVGSLLETAPAGPNTSLKTALALELNSVCNAAMTRQAVDFYTFQAQRGQRIVVDCAAEGIDSKLKPVLILADAGGADLLVERRGGSLDFTAPEDGVYVVKVHDLTYNGGPQCFYRLALMLASGDEIVPRLPATQAVSAYSWPPPGLSAEAAIQEVEPNDKHSQPQRITLPCDISGSFFPAADVDTFEFTAKQGEIWWVEIASERLGLPTDPSLVVQHVAPGNNASDNAGNSAVSGAGNSADSGVETLTDVAEFSDIPSPVKVSSNGYSYDGPPYNAGSTDLIGKIEIKRDGLHRLRLRDLFGGTRSDPRNVYRLVIRQAAPDFALVAWAMHMNLRNGDRNALSKPLALRGGATVALEVVALRRDGFDGEIELLMDNLPPGVTAAGLKIPRGEVRGVMLISAAEDAPQGMTLAAFAGRATIDGQTVERPCRLASMQWPVPDASVEIPAPRLLADVPVSVCAAEQAPLTIAPAEDKVWEAVEGAKLPITLTHTRRSEFSGASVSLKTFGGGFEKAPAFEASLSADGSEAVLDLAALKTPPGDYVIAFYGSAVAEYRKKSTVDIVVSTPITIRVNPAEKK